MSSQFLPSEATFCQADTLRRRPALSFTLLQLLLAAPATSVISFFQPTSCKEAVNQVVEHVITDHSMVIWAMAKFKRIPNCVEVHIYIYMKSPEWDMLDHALFVSLFSTVKNLG